MLKILITGANSYIGTAFERYINSKFANEYSVDVIDMQDENWKNEDFSNYDVIYHVAGIAHSDSGKISIEKERLYRAVNTDLTIEVANKAKKEGVKQFIFMSSAIVYGDSAKIGKKKRINKDTPCCPVNCYGDSKLQAENGLKKLESTSFKVVILRPPMIYGENCKGNFPVLEKFAKKLPIFPLVNNERSMLYIGNLVEFVRLIIKNNESGIFWPQNKEYVNTSQLVKMIANANGRKICLVKGCEWFLKIISRMTGLVNKAFGNLSYEQELSEYKEDYCKFTIEESIRECEKRGK